MENKKIYTAIGLMSGTSLDGVDIALIRTDGHRHIETGPAASEAYPSNLKKNIRKCFGLTDKKSQKAIEAERQITFFHASTIKNFLNKNNINSNDIDFIGFHGQTITHDIKNKFTWQIGDGVLLAKETEIDVINDFRSADVAAGGQGAPLLPLYHRARLQSKNIALPAMILNIGGVANITWIGSDKDADLIAFDTGPGNALIDDYIFTKTGQDYDYNGQLASKGEIRADILNSWMALPYFTLPLPKSLDRNAWDVSAIDYLSTEDAAATLSAFTVDAIRTAEHLLPKQANTCYVAGGGRHNTHIMAELNKALHADVLSIDVLGINGDSLEAEGFAYLAVRSALNLPLSLPMTTGVPEPIKGGTRHFASEKQVS